MRSSILWIIAVLLLLAGAIAWLSWGGASKPRPASDAAAAEADSARTLPAAGLAEGAPAEITRRPDAHGVWTLRALLPDGEAPARARFLLRLPGGAEWRAGAPSTLTLPQEPSLLQAAAYADGMWSAPAPPRPDSGGELLLPVLMPAANLRCSVSRADGAPLSAYFWRVEWEGALPGAGEEQAELGRLYAQAQTEQSAALAELELTDLPPGIWSVSVRASDLPPQRQSVRLQPGASAGLDFRLAAGAFVTGAVHGEDGQPLAAARVVVIPSQLELLENLFGGDLAASGLDWVEELAQPGGTAETGADGRFRAGPLAEGSYRVLASAPEHLPASSTQAVELAPGEERDAGILSLRRGQGLSVQVVAAASEQPIAGARVRYSPGVRDDSPFASALPWLPEAPPVTGPDGVARLENLAPGPITLQANAGGYAIRELVVVMPAAGDAPLQRIALEAALSIRGRVVDAATAAPIADASVAALPSQDGNWFEELLARERRGSDALRSGADGSFQISGLAPGTFRVRVHADGYAVGQAGPLRVGPGLPEPEAEVLLGRGGTLRVLVLDQDSAPRSGVEVTVFSFIGGEPDAAETGADGTALFEHLTPGEYQVSASSFAGDAQALALLGGDFSGLDTRMAQAQVREGELTELVLGGPVLRSTVQGTVSCQGEPQPGLSVLLISGGSFHAGRTDEDGFYEVEDVPAGEYMFMAGEMQIGGGAGWVGTLSVPGGDVVVYDVELPGASLRVRVLNARDGKPISGVMVMVRPEGSAMDMDTLITGADGTSLFRFLEPASYYVTAGRGAMPFGFGAGGGDRGSAIAGPVAVRGQDAEAQIELRLEAAASVRARVLDASGQPVQGAGLFYLDAKGQPLSLISITGTNADGWQELGFLPPGPGRIQARHPQLGVAERPVSLTAGQPAEIQLQLQGATTLRVTPVDREGRPAKGVQAMVVDERGAPVPVVFSGAEAMSAWTNYLNGGEQRIGPLSPGKYRLLLVRPGAGMTSEPLQITAGVAEMTLRPVFAP